MKGGVNSWAHDVGKHYALRVLCVGKPLGEYRGQAMWACVITPLHVHVYWPPTLVHAQCVVGLGGRTIVDSHAYVVWPPMLLRYWRPTHAQCGGVSWAAT